jgi:ABC-2 type transport system ATP-binding protein
MILSVQNVVKRYAGHTAVDHVSFDVPRGAVFGLLGPNGAGKTSLLRMITTITGPDEGVIELDGHKLNDRSPEKMGYMPEERGLYKKMKVGEHLMYLAQLKGMTEHQARNAIGNWLTKFDIESWWSKKVEDLSKGMQQKIQFIATVVHNPPLLILDEPFTGLDPINANLIKDEINQLHQSGTSIIFSTHRMEQVEEMCDHIVLINRGKNVLQGEVAHIKNAYRQHLYKIETPTPLSKDVLNSRFTITAQQKNALTFQLQDGQSGNDLLRYLLEKGVEINRFEEILPTFNEIFIKRVEETGEGHAE